MYLVLLLPSLQIKYSQNTLVLGTVCKLYGFECILKLVASSSIVHDQSQQVHLFVCSGNKQQKNVEIEASLGFLEQTKSCVASDGSGSVLKKLLTCFVERSIKHT